MSKSVSQHQTEQNMMVISQTADHTTRNLRPSCRSAYCIHPAVVSGAAVSGAAVSDDVMSDAAVSDAAVSDDLSVVIIIIVAVSANHRTM